MFRLGPTAITCDVTNAMDLILLLLQSKIYIFTNEHVTKKITIIIITIYYFFIKKKEIKVSFLLIPKQHCVSIS